MNTRGLFILPVLLTLAGCGDSCVTGPPSTAGLTEFQKAVLKMEAPWMKNAKTCQVEGYLVMAATDGSSKEIIVTRDGTTVVISGEGEIYLQAKDGSLVSVQDREDTGRFDWVSYSAIDPDDGQEYSITDANADGRLDTKLGEHAGFVNLGGEWFRFEKQGDQIGAVVHGEWRALEKHGRVHRLKSP